MEGQPVVFLIRPARSSPKEGNHRSDAADNLGNGFATLTNSGACSLPMFGMVSFPKDVGDLLGCKVSVSHWSIDR